MKIKALKNLLRTLILAFPIIVNMFKLLFLLLFVYSLIGCTLFHDIDDGNGFNEYLNFKNVAYGIILLFKVITADSWGDLILDILNQRKSKYCTNLEENCVDCIFSIKYKIKYLILILNCKFKIYQGHPLVFFITFIILANFLFFNLFILVLLQQFEEYYKNSISPIYVYDDNIHLLKENWKEFRQDKTTMKIDDLFKFLKSIEPPLGFITL